MSLMLHAIDKQLSHQNRLSAGLQLATCKERLTVAPSVSKVHQAIKHMSSNKAPGVDSLPAEVSTYGGMHLTHQLVYLFSLIWCEEQVPQDFKDASIIHLYRYQLGDQR